MQFTDEQVGRLVTELQEEYAPHMARLRVRRLLLEMASESYVESNGTGTNVPEPFDRSKLIIRTIIGEPSKELQRYAARVSSNAPTCNVIPPVIGKEEVTKTADKHAAEQERLLMAMLDAAGGKKLQRQISWSQCWGRVGWYLTMPRDAEWGLPDRIYYDDISEDELEAMRNAGMVTPEPIEDPKDGTFKHAESAGSWIERRQRVKHEKAVAGASLNTLEALPPDVVYPRWDRDGLKYVAVIEEVPSSTFAPGSELALSAGKLDDVSSEDMQRYTLIIGKDGKVEGGVTKGGEPGSTKGTAWKLVRFFTRNEVYYFAAASTGQMLNGKVVWHQEHGDGIVPVIPSPFAETDSMRPGAEFTSPLEAVFAYTPAVNQLMTLLSNVGAFNGIPRWVIESKDGQLIPDAETGEPRVLNQESAVGLDPKDAEVVGGTIKQLKIEDPDILLSLLQFYMERLDMVKIPDVATGAAGTSGPAWNVRQQIAQTQIDLQPAVDNHASAVEQVFKIWIRRMRKLGEPVLMFAAPGKRGSMRSMRGLIEFDPENLVESIQVTQDSNTPSDRIVLQQHGIELLAAGRIDDRQYFETYALEADPEEAETRIYVQSIKKFVLVGDTSQVAPGSVLHNVALAVQGRVTQQLLQQSPNFALASAEQMAAEAQQQALMETQAMTGQGSPASATGLSQPGIGQATTLDQQMPRQSVLGAA